MARPGYTNVRPSEERNEYFKVICGALNQDWRSHQGRLAAIDHALRCTVKEIEPIDNEWVQGMARSALDNWLFDEDTDPDGQIKRGLDFLAEEGDWGQDIIDAHLKHRLDWDGLGDWAKYLGS